MDFLQVMMQNKEEIGALILKKGQRGSEQSAILCGSGDDQNSHCARRGHWKIQKDYAISKH